MVDDDQTCIRLLDDVGQFLDLAAAEQRGGPRFVDCHGRGMRDVEVDRPGKAYRFFQPCLG